MVRSLADERFQENLEAAKTYYDQHWTLCAPRSAAALDRPVGQWMSNLRRPGALDDHPEWETALEAADKDWNPSWPPEWQRHYAALRGLVTDEEGPANVLPGVTVHGMDIGKWLARQRKPEVWQALTDGQRERLEQLGITPLPPAPEAPVKPSTAPVSAFEEGVAALAQYKTREGRLRVPSRDDRDRRPRARSEGRRLPVEHEVKTRKAHCRQTPATGGSRTGVGWEKLTGVQQWMFEQVLGIEPAAEDEKPQPRRAQADKWAANLAAARQFFEREVHLRVPRKHVETITVGGGGGEDQEQRELRLGAWIGNQRSRAATLTPERIEQLSKIGMRWT
ncbi:helicase associated domain-containing protein [Streptomyces sp. NPDC056237]|uniref:helicase associated domain-containing protein n=1 Tax=unclassified Streptomyces TaxID=2593676 RepID=UPI0035D5BBA0